MPPAHGLDRCTATALSYPLFAFSQGRSRGLAILARGIECGARILQLLLRCRQCVGNPETLFTYPDGPRRAGQGEQDRRARIWLGPRQTAEAAAGRIALTGSDRERQATEIRARSPDEGRGGAQRGIQATTSEPAKRYPQYVNRQAERKGAVCLSPLTRLTPRIFDEGDSRRDGKAALEGGDAVGAEAGPVIGA